MHWMILPLRRYADFRGRSRRLEFWMFWLFLLIGFAVATWLDIVLGFARSMTVVDAGPGLWSRATVVQGGLLSGTFGLAVLIPSLAVMVRRLHDIGRSGLWLLLSFVPVIGALVLLVFYLTGSQRGANRWGADPLDPVARPAALG